MNIIVKTLSGRGKDIIVQVNPLDNVAKLKEQINGSEGIPVDQQVLIFCGKVLVDECTFTEYNIQKNSTVHLALKTKDGKLINIIVNHIDLVAPYFISTLMQGRLNSLKVVGAQLTNKTHFYCEKLNSYEHL